MRSFRKNRNGCWNAESNFVEERIVLQTLKEIDKKEPSRKTTKPPFDTLTTSLDEFKLELPKAEIQWRPYKVLVIQKQF